MIAKLVIGVLAAILLVLLYRGMRAEQARAVFDPNTPPDVVKIHAVIRAYGYPCDAVISFTPLGKSRQGTDSYLARCRDGGRYVYFQDPEHRRLNVTSCS